MQEEHKKHVGHGAFLPDEVLKLQHLSDYTTPSPVRFGIVCIDDCDSCPLYAKCVKICNRFPDMVCSTCPCRASKFIGEKEINDIGTKPEDYTGNRYAGRKAEKEKRAKQSEV